MTPNRPHHLARIADTLAIAGDYDGAVVALDALMVETRGDVPAYLAAIASARAERDEYGASEGGWAALRGGR